MAIAIDAAGIDIGHYRTKVTRLHQQKSGEVEIVFQGSFPSPGQKDVLFSASDELCLVTPHTLRANVTIGVSGQSLFRLTKLPPIAPERIPAVAAYEAEQQIPFDMNEIEWFYHQFDDDGFGGNDIELGIFAIRKSVLDQSLDMCERGGFEVVHFAQPVTVAIYNAMTYLNLWGPESTLVLDIGHESTNLMIRGSDSTCWVRTIPLGAMAFVKALAKSFKLSESKALIMLRSVDESKYKSQLLQSFRPVFADIAAEVQRSVGFFSSTHSSSRHPTGERCGQIAFLGQTSLIPGLRKYVVTNTGIEELELSPNHAEYLVSYGLALQGFSLTAISGDFMPKKSLGTKVASALQHLPSFKFIRNFSFVEWWVVASLIMLLVSILFSGLSNNETVPVIKEQARTPPQRALDNPPKEPYVIIRILTESDGVHFDPQFYPPLQDSGNPLSHRIGKTVLEELGVGSDHNKGE